MLRSAISVEQSKERRNSHEILSKDELNVLETYLDEPLSPCLISPAKAFGAVCSRREVTGSPLTHLPGRAPSHLTFLLRHASHATSILIRLGLGSIVLRPSGCPPSAVGGGDSSPQQSPRRDSSE